jgi:outer membrane protein assembly factor BamD
MRSRAVEILQGAVWALSGIGNMVRYAIRYVSFVALLAALTVSSGCRKKVYENKIHKDTQQPDKVLYDTSIDDIEHGRFERARLTLQTLMNTYDTSEYLAKAKLAMADSWYREGGSRGFSQAEAEYKDFILFYKSMEEAAEAQMKICKMQFDQMDKSDRDPHHALRAQEECKDVLLEFPNSKFAVEASQYLRDVQEVLADEEFRVQTFYAKKGSFPASANRGQALTEQFPLYSNAAEANWMLADAYQHLGDRFENQQAAAYARIVQEYPLSSRSDSAKLRLQAMHKDVPDVDPIAYARQRYEMENREKRGFLGKAWVPFSSRPDLLLAAKSGTPSMEGLKPTIPASVPQSATGTQGTSATPGTGTAGTGEVTGVIVDKPDLVDKRPDARLSITPDAGAPAPAGATPAGGNTVTAAPGASAPAPAPDTPTRSTTAPNGKAKTLAQQESDLKREQAQIQKEKQKIQDQLKKRTEIMQEMAKRQQVAAEKKRAEEDADRKRVAKAAAKKAMKQAPKPAPAAAPAQPDKQPDKPASGSAGGESPTAKP